MGGAVVGVTGQLSKQGTLFFQHVAITGRTLGEEVVGREGDGR